jgi:UDP-N-acetylmuramate--alanine ligase
LIAKVPKTGSVITDFEHPNIKPVLTACKANLVNFSAVNTSGLKLKFPGKHNIKNAQAAIAVAAILEVPREEAIKSLNDFKGTWRRFEYKGETAEGALVYDDYAHNPQKIQAALQGVREIYPDRKIIAVFQPHLYSRTKTLLAGFSKSFSDADKVILAPIFPAREAFDSTISSEILAEEIKKNYPNKMLRHIATFEEIAKFLKNEAKKGDIIIFLGAGDLYKLAEKLVVER